MSCALFSAGPTNHFTGIHWPKVTVCWRGAAEARAQSAKTRAVLRGSIVICEGYTIREPATDTPWFAPPRRRSGFHRVDYVNETLTQSRKGICISISAAL